MTAKRRIKKAKTIESVDVLIAGGGMVGVALAAALAPSGLQIAVVEARELAAEEYLPRVLADNATGHDPRVSALTPVSEQILKTLGAWPLMESLRICPYQHMHVWDGEGTAKIDFDAAEVYQPRLGHIVENRVILAGLYEAAKGFANIHWLNPVKVSAVGAAELDEENRWQRKIQLNDGRELSCRLLVAADGARSRTRQLAGIPITEWDYQHQAIVTTVAMEKSHQQTAWQRFTEDGPLAFLPLPDSPDGQHFCSIVWSTSPEHSQQLMGLDDAAFSAQLGTAFENQLGPILSVDARHKYPLIQRHAKEYVSIGVALVGDAAHSIHPLAGQGVNLGFLDAATLAEEVLLCVDKQIDFADSQRLRRYQRRRQGEVWKMMGLMAGFRHLYGDVPPPVHWLRNLGMRQVDRLEPFKRKLIREALGFNEELPALARASA